jgi:hypothetical protein
MSWGRDPHIRSEEEPKQEKKNPKDEKKSEAWEMVRALGKMSTGGGGHHTEDSERP